MGFSFGEVVQIFELKRVGGAPKGHPFAPLADMHNMRHLDNQEKEVQLYLVKTAAPKGTSALSEVKVLTINRPATTYTQLVNHLVLWQKKNYKESLIQANQQIHLTNTILKPCLQYSISIT